MCSKANKIEIRIEELLRVLGISGLHPKFWIIEYFDNLINRIDLIVEKIIIKLHDNSMDMDDVQEEISLEDKIFKMNLIREEFINQIKNCMTHNVDNFECISDEVNFELEQVIENFKSEFKTNQLNESLENEFKSSINRIQGKIFTKFCFLIKLPQLNRKELGDNCMRFFNKFFKVSPCNKIGKLIVVDWFINKDHIE